MKLPEEKTVRALHSAYCRLVGEMPLTLDRIYWWNHWIQNGWSEKELSLVIRSIQSGISKGKRNQGALRWSNLIQRADNFSEELAMARAEERNRPKPVTAKERAVAQLRPGYQPPKAGGAVRSVADVIEAMRRAAG